MKKLVFIILVLAGCAEEEIKPLKSIDSNPLDLFTQDWTISTVKFNNSIVSGYEAFEFPFKISTDQTDQTLFPYTAGGPNPSAFPSAGFWYFIEEGSIIRDKGEPSEVGITYEVVGDVLTLRFTLKDSGYPNDNPTNGQTDLRGDWEFSFK